MSKTSITKRSLLVLIVLPCVFAGCNLGGPRGEPLDPSSPDQEAETSSGDGGSDPEGTGQAGSGQVDAGPAGTPYTPNPLSVTFQFDESSRTTAAVPVGGGALTATDPDGVVYTLTVPAGGLISSERISMTPLASVDDAPVRSAFRVGVRLEPSGLEFIEPAILSITVPSGIPDNADSGVVAFGAEANGDEFHFKRVEAVSDTTVTVEVRHFSGAGVVEATDVEVTDQQENHPPTDVQDWAEQELATDPTVETEVATLRGVHAQTLATISAAGSSAVLMDQAFQQFRFWRLRFSTARAEVQTRLAGLDAELLARFISTFELALAQARMDCRNHDLSQIGRLLRWSYLVLTYPEISAGLTDSQSIVDDAVACARFELEFDSTVESFGAALDTNPIVTAVSGTAEIGATVGVATGIELKGQGALSYTRTQYYDTDGCTNTFVGQSGLLRVHKLDVGYNLATAGTTETGPSGLPASGVGVFLTPEGLSESIAINCDGTVIFQDRTTHFLGGWAALHLNQNTTDGFEIRGWVPGDAGSAVVGTRQFSGGTDEFVEDTRLRLIHTPTL